MARKIVAVFGDMGGWNESAAAVDVLAAKGLEVHILVDPSGKAADKMGARRYASTAPTECDAIVVGTSVTAVAAQLAWTDFGRSNGIPVIWVEDMYGTGSRDTVRGCRGPDVMCVIDRIAAKIAQRTWPEAKIVVCGKPTFTYLAGLIARQDEIRAQVRDHLGVAADERLLTWWGGGEVGADELETLGAGIIPALVREAGMPSLRLASRPHPKLAKVDAAAWARIVEVLGAAPFTVNAELAKSVNADELTIASDVVVGTWGTTQCLVAAVARVSCVCTHFPSQDAERRALGYPEGMAPVVTGGAAMHAASAREVSSMILRAVRRSRVIPDVQKVASEPFKALIDPDAPANIAGAIIEAIG